MKSWRTTGLALLSAGFGFVLFSPELFSQWPWLVHLSKYVALGGLAGLGIAAKDAAVHSTAAQVQEASTAEKERLLRS